MVETRQRRLLYWLARQAIFHPWSVLMGCVALAALSSFYAVRHMEFVSGRNDLISAEKRYVQLDDEYADEFMGVDQVVVVVEPKDVQQGKDFVTRLGEVLLRDTAHVSEVFYHIDTASLAGKKLLYLSPDDLRSLRDNLEEYSDLIQELTTSPGLNTLFRAINQQVSAGMVSHIVSGFLGLEASPEEKQAEAQPVRVTFLSSLLGELDQALGTTDYGYHSPWAKFFGDAEELADDGFLVSANRRFVFLMVEPQENREEEAIVAIRKAVQTLKGEFLGLKVGVTGTEALNTDETASTQADAGVATVVSLLGVTLLYLLFFRKIRHPLFIISALTIGLAWTMGFVTLAVGHLTIITVFVGPMLLGLADDFGVHFIARYEEERSLGSAPAEAIHMVFAHSVPGIGAGAFTTALAFAAVMLADFRGVQELGLIAAAGMLLSFLAIVTFLPALIVLVERHLPWTVQPSERTFLAGAFAGWGTRMERIRWPLSIVAGLCTLGGLVALPGMSFDYNLLNLQARGTESVEWEKRIIENSERSSRDALTSAPTPEEAMRKAAAFEALSSVESVESVASLIPGGQPERIELVRALQPLLGSLPPMLVTPEAIEVRDLARTLDKLKLKLREDNTEWDPSRKPSEQDLGEVRRHLLAVGDQLQSTSETEVKARLGRFQEALFRDFQEKWSLLRNNLDPTGPITLADIPAQLKSRFVSRDGAKFLLQIFPKKNVWEKEAQEEFVEQIRQVDPDVTGNPVIGYESIRAMRDGYVEGGLYAFLAIVLVTFVTLRKLGDTVLAILPLGLGIVWTAGLMWVFGLQFNLANMVAVPLIIGIGVENGIHIVHRYRESGLGGPALVAGSTGQAVALFSLTTMIGFGSLMVARYYGIFSMGLLLTLAVGSVLVASLAILPLLLLRSVPHESVTSQPQVSPMSEAPRQRSERRSAAGRG
ncbi:MAG: MMPL family transporter [Deltaproteobacteria bacterium]|nr:MMPL family transporter [Deltaproteobacteria bacterium]